MNFSLSSPVYGKVGTFEVRESDNACHLLCVEKSDIF
jgi:hypothetical protein